MAFLLYPLLGFSLFGGKKEEKDTGMSMPSLASLICCALCLGFMGYGIFRSPIKTPPMMIAMAVFCCCSSSSMGSAVKDITKKAGMS